MNEMNALLARPKLCEKDVKNLSNKILKNLSARAMLCDEPFFQNSISVIKSSVANEKIGPQCVLGSYA